MCPSRSAEALRGHINVPIAYKELNRHWNTFLSIMLMLKTIADNDLKALNMLNIVLCTTA